MSHAVFGSQLPIFFRPISGATHLSEPLNPGYRTQLLVEEHLTKSRSIVAEIVANQVAATIIQFNSSQTHHQIRPPENCHQNACDSSYADLLTSINGVTRIPSQLQGFQWLSAIKIEGDMDFDRETSVATVKKVDVVVSRIPTCEVTLYGDLLPLQSMFSKSYPAISNVTLEMPLIKNPYNDMFMVLLLDLVQKNHEPQVSLQVFVEKSDPNLGEVQLLSVTKIDPVLKAYIVWVVVSIFLIYIKVLDALSAQDKLVWDPGLNFKLWKEITARLAYGFAYPIVVVVEVIAHALKLSEYHNVISYCHWFQSHRGFEKGCLFGFIQPNMVYKILNKLQLVCFVQILISRSLIILYRLQEKKKFCWNSLIESLATYRHEGEPLASFRKVLQFESKGLEAICCEDKILPSYLGLQATVESIQVDMSDSLGFLAEGIERTSAGLGNVIIGSQPLEVAILATLLIDESIEVVGAVGPVLGAVGILLLEPQIFKESIVQKSAFKTEVKMPMMVYIKNLVSLIGYWSKEKKKVNVYKFMVLNLLEGHLRDPCCSKEINWNTQMKLAVGASQGLYSFQDKMTFPDYLHDKMTSPIICHDLKCTNTLIGEGYHPKFSDSGLDKFLLMEIVSGRKEVDNRRSHAEQYFIWWVRPLFSKVFHLIDDSALEGPFKAPVEFGWFGEHRHAVIQEWLKPHWPPPRIIRC